MREGEVPFSALIHPDARGRISEAPLANLEALANADGRRAGTPGRGGGDDPGAPPARGGAGAGAGGSGSGRGAPREPASAPEPEEEPIGRALTPEGEEVVLYPTYWRHIEARRYGRLTRTQVLDAILTTSVRRPDPDWSNRVHLWSRGPGPTRWLYLVAQEGRTGYFVITAIPSRKDPKP